MPPPTPLHASERKLGWFMLAAIPLPATMLVLAHESVESGWLIPYLGNWVRAQWDVILQGSRPTLSSDSLITVLVINLIAGAAIMVPWHLRHLLGHSLWTSPGTLWLWSGLYGLVPFGVGASYLHPMIIDEKQWVYSLLPFDIANIGGVVLGLGITVFGFRAWHRRRMEDRAGLAAETSADPALPH